MSNTPITLLEIVKNTLGNRARIKRHEMAALLTAWSRERPGAIANGYVPRTWPTEANDLPLDDDAAWSDMWARCADDFHVHAGRAWADMVGGITLVNAGEPGTLRDGGVRYDQPGSMAPGQHSAVSFLGSQCAQRAETREYIRRHCDRLLIVDEDSPLIVPPTSEEVDGTWVRYLYASELAVDWTVVRDHLEEFGEEPDMWQEQRTEKADRLSPHRILQMIDPNSGQGSDATQKQRYQYVRIDGTALSRMLPPESFGDTWRGEPAPRPFRRIDAERGGGAALSDYILRLLDA